MNDLSSFSHYHPSWEGQEFSQEEYQSLLEDLSKKTKTQKLLTDGKIIKKIDTSLSGAITKLWQRLKGWLGFDNHLDPVKVNYDLLKLLRYGNNHQYFISEQILALVQKLKQTLTQDTNHSYEKVIAVIEEFFPITNTSLTPSLVDREISDYYKENQDHLHEAFWPKLFHKYITPVRYDAAKLHYNQANIEIAEGFYAKAIENLESALEINQSHSIYRLTLAKTLLKLASSEPTEQALIHSQRALTILHNIADSDETLSSAFKACCVLNLEQKNYAEALKYLEESNIDAIEPLYQELLITCRLGLADQAFVEKSYPEAIEHFEIAHELDTQNKSILERLTNCYLITEDSEKAVEVLNRLKELEYETHDLEMALGELYLKQRNYDKALVIFSELAENSVDKTRYHGYLHNCHLGKASEATDPTSALMHYETSLNFASDEQQQLIAERLLEIGDKFLREGQREHAFNYFTKALSSSQDIHQLPEPLVALAKEHITLIRNERLFNGFMDAGNEQFNKQQYSQAIAFYTQAIPVATDQQKVDITARLLDLKSQLIVSIANEGVLNELAACYRENGNIESADAILREIQEFKQSEEQLAIQAAAAAIRAENDRLFKQHSDAGFSQTLQGKYTEAIANYNQAISVATPEQKSFTRASLFTIKNLLILNSESITIFNKLAECFIAADDNETATDLIQEVAEFKELERQRAIEAEAAAIKAENERLFNSFIDVGDARIEQRQFSEAIANYTKALSFATDEQKMTLTERFMSLSPLLESQDAATTPIHIFFQQFYDCFRGAALTLEQSDPAKAIEFYEESLQFANDGQKQSTAEKFLLLGKGFQQKQERDLALNCLENSRDIAESVLPAPQQLIHEANINIELLRREVACDTLIDRAKEQELQKMDVTAIATYCEAIQIASSKQILIIATRLLELGGRFVNTSSRPLALNSYKSISPHLKSLNLQPQDAIAILKTLAEERKEHGDYLSALNYYREALTFDPNSYELNAEIGELYFHQNDKENALKHYQKSMDLSPDNIVYKQRLANIEIAIGNQLFARGLAQKQLQSLQDLIRYVTIEAPFAIDIQNALGTRLGSWSADNTTLKRLDLEVTTATQLNQNSRRALELIRSAYDGGSNHKRPQEMPQDLTLRLEAFENHLRLLHSTIESVPQDFQNVFENLEGIQTDPLLQAITSYEKANTRFPEVYKTHLNRYIAALTLSGSHAKALNFYRKLKIKHPSERVEITPLAYQAVSEAFLASNKYKEAFDITEKGLAEFPENIMLKKLKSDLCFELGELAIHRNDLQNALSFYTLSTQCGIDTNAQPYIALAKLHIQAMYKIEGKFAINFQAAVNNLKKAADLSPDNAELRFQLARIAYNSPEKINFDILPYIEQATRLMPDNIAYAYAHLMSAIKKNGSDVEDPEIARLHQRFKSIGGSIMGDDQSYWTINNPLNFPLD